MVLEFLMILADIVGTIKYIIEDQRIKMKKENILI
jgi:hypothetical protein